MFHPVATLIQSMKCLSYCPCSLSSLCLYGPSFPQPHLFFLNMSHLLANLSFLSPGYCIHLGSSRDKKKTLAISMWTLPRTEMTSGNAGSTCWPETRGTCARWKNRLRPFSPSPVVHYSEHKCSGLGDQIKGW